MMRTIEIRKVVLGKDKPKICVPLVGKNDEALRKEIEVLNKISFDVIEWRMDHHEAAGEIEKMKQTVKMIREAVGDVPLLATFRTKKEGGEKEVSTAYYLELNKAMIKTAAIDLIDVEFFTGENEVKEVVAYAHAHQVKVVMSNHDFDKTPDKEEIIGRLRGMQELGADLPKIAVMPQKAEDVITLLAATNEMATRYADRPIITMSMGRIGLVSRIAGETFGSCLTFGAAKEASAPGQIAAAELGHVLQVIHGK